jgi:hypothetical protein
MVITVNVDDRSGGGSSGGVGCKDHFQALREVVDWCVQTQSIVGLNWPKLKADNLQQLNVTSQEYMVESLCSEF